MLILDHACQGTMAKPKDSQSDSKWVVEQLREGPLEIDQKLKPKAIQSFFKRTYNIEFTYGTA